MIKIRDFTAEDADKVCGFKRESARVNFPGCQFDEAMFRDLIMKSFRSFPERIKVAEDGGTVVGYIWFKVIRSATGVFGRIEHIFVDESWRGKGLGKMLMETAEEYFRKRGVKKVKLTVTTANRKAIKLYSEMGYETRRYKMEKDL